jgi:phage gpG-like protein
LKEGFNIKGIHKKARTIMEKSLIIIGNEAKNHFVKSFEIQGFQDAVTERWKPRKKMEKGKRRAILVKSGDLRRSIKRERVNKFRLQVLISSDLPYARRHNEGLKNMPKRQFIGNSRILNTKLKFILNKRLEAVFK